MIETQVVEAARVVLRVLEPEAVYRDRDATSDPPRDTQGPTKGRVTPYYSIFNVVAPPSPFALRRGGTVLASGFLQVSLYLPTASGRAVATALADRVVKLFPRLLHLGPVRVEPLAYATSPLQAPPYIQVPITVPWRARLLEKDL